MESNEQNVLVPGAGGAAGIGAIKSLRLMKHGGTIVSTDSNELSAGLYLADKGYVVPPAKSPSFLESVSDIIHAEHIDVVLPTSGFDIVPYSRHKTMLEREGVTVAMSDQEVIETCLNKMKLYHALRKEFNLPFTAVKNSSDITCPCVVKPIFGKGSKDVFICYSDAEIEEKMATHENMLIQEYLPGPEFTIDVLSDLHGKGMIAIPRERVEVKAGISFKGRIVFDERMQNECMKLAEYLGVKGPSCIQMKCDKNGKPKIVEVNPRMGGGTIMATYAGVNFPYLTLKLACNEQVNIGDIQEITMLRYYEEVILDKSGEVVYGNDPGFWRSSR